MKHSKHVVPAPNGGWNVKSGGVTVSHHRTQSEAREVARTFAQLERTEVIVHGRDGRFRDKDSYGSDPYPPRG